MSFERDIKAIFGVKADEFSDHHKLLLKRVWDCGRREGHHKSKDQLTQFYRQTVLNPDLLGSRMPKSRTGFPPDVIELMEGFWRASFDEGMRTGQGRLDVVFSRVVRHLPTQEVFDLDTASRAGMSSLSVAFKPWVLKAFEKVLEADSTDEAMRIAEEQRTKYDGGHPPDCPTHGAPIEGPH